MQKMLTAVVLACAITYMCACLALYVLQRSLIYFPPQNATVTADKISWLQVPGANVKVSERPYAGTKAVLYLGGNAEDVSANLPLLKEVFPEHALYLLHYRGYAGSSGSPSEEALVSDALTLFDRIATDHPDIVVMGRSLGSGVAVHVASLRPIKKLVLITPYDSIQEMAVRQYPYFPIRWMLKDKYESWRYAPLVKAPTLIIAAEHDEVIPMWSTQLLFSRFGNGIATMKIIDGAGHNSISANPDYVFLLQWAN